MAGAFDKELAMSVAGKAKAGRNKG